MVEAESQVLAHNDRQQEITSKDCGWFGKRISGRLINYSESQAARQGLAVLMASTVVVLKHEISTFRQSHNFISIDFKFGVGDYVTEVTSSDKISSGPMSGKEKTWG